MNFAQSGSPAQGLTAKWHFGCAVVVAGMTVLEVLMGWAKGLDVGALVSISGLFLVLHVVAHFGARSARAYGRVASGIGGSLYLLGFPFLTLLGVWIWYLTIFRWPKPVEVSTQLSGAPLNP